MVIESTSLFKGLYHVLGGKISPTDSVGPQDLNINSLVEKVKSNKIRELVFAMSPTMEGDTTNFYIFKQIKDYNVITSTIARGVAASNKLEYTDEVTLARSIIIESLLKPHSNPNIILKLSVIILNYNVRYFLELCLKSVEATIKTIDTEVIVVDNNSSDKSCEMVK